MQDDAARWDTRYRDAAPIVASPPELLRAQPELLAQLPTSGVALDIACGLGSQSLWMAARGFHVTGIDVSTVAIERLRSAALAGGLADRIDALAFDLDEGLPTEPSTLDLIVCQRFRSPALYRPIADRLRSGGIGIVTVLVGSDRGPFHAPPGELRAAYVRSDVEILFDTERDDTATIAFRRR